MMRTCCEAIRKAGATVVVISFMQSASGQPGDTRTQLRLGGLPQWRYKVLSPPLLQKSIRGQCRWSLAMGGTSLRHGAGAAADNWAWDSVATKQHSLRNEINDVVLGLVSPRRGLSPNSHPKVRERTITQTQIHQAHSPFRPSSKLFFRAGSGLIPTEEE